MSNEIVLGMIKDFVTGHGFTLVAEDVSHDDYLEAESFAIRDTSGATFFVSVNQIG